MGNSIQDFTRKWNCCCMPDPKKLTKFEHESKQQKNHKKTKSSPRNGKNTRKPVIKMETPLNKRSSEGSEESTQIIRLDLGNFESGHSDKEFNWANLSSPVNFTPSISKTPSGNKADIIGLQSNNNKLSFGNNLNKISSGKNGYYKPPTTYVVNGKLPMLIDADSNITSDITPRITNFRI
mmetsp:Transcript_83505/g.102329  ORF Transcript_83505/g.102329 Transcript_83505/m.102329 type:complete len:180 (-) Transcript_83505:65-604(-)